MKTSIFKATSLFLVTLFVLATAAPLTVKADTKTKMQEYVEAMQPGWNLGNSFDATGDETSWGNPKTTKELIDAIAAQGFKSIRIPVTWGHRMDKNNVIKPEFLARVKEVVDWSLDAGMYVMLNMHHDAGEWIINMGTNHDIVLAKFNAAWTQIADYFKDYPDKLMFEAINEPRFDEDWNKNKDEYFEYLHELNLSFYNIVRSSGGKNKTRPLVLSSLTSSPAVIRLRELKKTITELDDDNIIATVHYYGYWPFSVNIAGTTTFDDQTRADIESTFDRVYNMFVKEGIPVVIGEYGLLGFDNDIGAIEYGEVLKYFEYLTWYARQKGMTHMLWDNGQHFDRTNLVWRDKAKHDIIMQSLKGRSSTAASDLVFIKKGMELKDVEVPLNLNGNNFKGLRLGDEALSEGQDYSLIDEKLVIKKELLERVLTDQCGVNGTLYCMFSAGPDWKIDIIQYDTPFMKSVKRTTDSFMIPTQFNGDRLKTMEAVYVKGGIAGPQNWTSFKEFSVAFRPQYGMNTIHLTKDFFKEVRDAEVRLKFHFWSGEIVEYTISKSGSWVTGTSSQEEPIETEEPSTTASPEPTGSEEPQETDADPASNEGQPDGGRLPVGVIIALVLGGAAIIVTGVWYYLSQAKKAD